MTSTFIKVVSTTRQGQSPQRGGFFRSNLHSERDFSPSTSATRPSAFLLGFASALLLFGAGMTYAGPSTAGRAEFELCQSCHGNRGQGNRELNAPRLAGLDAEYVDRQLFDFRSGRRGATAADQFGGQMTQMAKTLRDDAAVKDVARYISTLAAPLELPDVNGSDAAGKAIFVTCASCHGTKGEGNPALQAPRLACMSDWYLLRQLQAFRAGWRGSEPADSPGARMKAIAMGLPGEAAMRDVIDFIDTLPVPAAQDATSCGSQR